MVEIFALLGVLTIAVIAGRRNGHVQATVIKVAELVEEADDSDFSAEELPISKRFENN